MSTLIKKTELRYKSGTSDKVYIVELIQDETRSYEAYKVDCQYGRRNYTLKTINKLGWNGKSTAEETFDNIVNSKIYKGYSVYDKKVFPSAKLAPKEPMKKLGKLSIKELLKFSSKYASKVPSNYESLPDYKKITYIEQFIFPNQVILYHVKNDEWRMQKNYINYNFKIKMFCSGKNEEITSDLFNCLEILENL